MGESSGRVEGVSDRDEHNIDDVVMAGSMVTSASDKDHMEDFIFSYCGSPVARSRAQTHNEDYINADHMDLMVEFMGPHMDEDSLLPSSNPDAHDISESRVVLPTNVKPTSLVSDYMEEAHDTSPIT